VSSPSSSVQHARKALGLRLREIRLDAGITARDLARLMGRHPSKISRTEHGWRRHPPTTSAPGAGSAVPPTKHPTVPRPGQVLSLAPGDIRWREREAPVVRVRRVREDISGCYDGAAVWLEVDELDDLGRPVLRRQLLVSTKAIARQAPPGG